MLETRLENVKFRLEQETKAKEEEACVLEEESRAKAEVDEMRKREKIELEELASRLRVSLEVIQTHLLPIFLRCILILNI